jgi:hypothetical protein
MAIMRLKQWAFDRTQLAAPHVGFSGWRECRMREVDNLCCSPIATESATPKWPVATKSLPWHRWFADGSLEEIVPQGLKPTFILCDLTYGLKPVPFKTMHKSDQDHAQIGSRLCTNRIKTMHKSDQGSGRAAARVRRRSTSLWDLDPTSQDRDVGHAAGGEVVPVMEDRS